MRRTIYVAGYPKSGTTWLTRLLGDVLNCPTGGSLPQDDAIEPASEGHGRPAPFIVRKGHFRLTDAMVDRAVPESHVLAHRALSNEGVVWIYRDTRDVVASVRHYWQLSSMQDAILKMAKSTDICAYEAHMYPWLDASFNHMRVCYKSLWESTEAEVRRILAGFGIKIEDKHIQQSIHRQSFAVRKRHAALYGDTMPLGRQYHMRFYRCGHPGAWRDQLSQQDIALVEYYFDDIMSRLGFD